MENTKHTPGPWTSTHDADVQQPTFHIGTPLEPDVARVNDCIEQAEANARLIAAAPELLAFAQMVADDYKTASDDLLDGVIAGHFTVRGISPRMARHIKAARAAIAKATGTNI